MKTVRRFLKRLVFWASTKKHEERLQSEIEEHLALQTLDNLRAGLPAEEARRQAVLKFGAVEAVREEYRDGRGLPAIESFWQDTRQAARRLRKAPGFTAATVLTLALGLGATTSIFTLVHAVLMKSLLVANPKDLYRLGKESHCCVWGGYQQYKEFSIVSYELYKYFEDHTKGFVELAAFQGGQTLLGVKRASSSEIAQSGLGEFVSGNYFKMFGVSAYAGRPIREADDREGAAPVAVMSYRLWQQKYGRDPRIIGTVLNLDDKPFTIVGVTTPGFFGDTLRDTPPDFFLPLATEPMVEGDSSLLRRPSDHWLDLIGRIEPRASPHAIEAQMRVELKQWLRSHWGDMDNIGRANFPQQTLYLEPGGAGITSLREQYEHWLNILMTVTAFVLLIVCANVANLMLVRGIERRQQTSLSLALGAGAGRIVRQALTESILLSLAGGAAGLALAFAGTRLILRFAFPPTPGFPTVPIEAAPSMPVLLFAFSVALATGVVFGIAPGWFATRIDPIEALRGANRSTARTGSLWRKLLVVLQAALALVLLSTSGLLTAALHRLENQDFGFEQDGRMVVNIDPQLAGYRAYQLTPLYRRITEAMDAIPGVESAVVCLYAPQSGDSWTDGIYVNGHPVPGPKDDSSAGWMRTTPGYFATLGNRILRGRGISEQDTENSRHIAVINEAFAKKFFKNEDPMGKFFGRSEAGASRQREIVGVTKDARMLTYNLDKPIDAFFYVPESQYDAYPTASYTQGDVRSHYMHDVVILMKPGSKFSESEVRRALAGVDVNLPINFMHSMRDLVAGNFAQQRLIARLTSFFGVLSLILASIGLYGVTAYNAGRRVNEIGVRMALGANRGDVISLVLRGAFGLIAIGLLIGLPLTLGSGRLLGALLYGMSPYNAAVVAVSIVALGISAFLASLLPALRASWISPFEALRSE